MQIFFCHVFDLMLSHKSLMLWQPKSLHAHWDTYSNDTLTCFFSFTLFIQTHVGFSASLHLTHLFSQIPANGNTQTHVGTVRVQTAWAASFKRRRFHRVLQYRGVALPPVRRDKRAMLHPDRAIWVSTLHPPFHTKNTQSYTAGW